jgi:hypothetical protein
MDKKIFDFARRINTTRSVYIKHRSNTDVVFWCLRGDETHAEDVANPSFKIFGWWINVAFMKPAPICSDEIVIKTPDLTNWVEVDKPENRSHA